MLQIYRKKNTPKTEEVETNNTTKKGRPKGSKNINRRDVKLSIFLEFVKDCLIEVKNLIGSFAQPIYFLFDGELGNNFGVQMAHRAGFFLISKLRHDAELYVEWDGEYSGRGRKRIYGMRLRPNAIPELFLQSITTENGVCTRIYHIPHARHKKFADAINVVIIHKTNVETGKIGHVILFCSDLELSWDKVFEYYCLRFQIEFNFRDAKQFWGLEDFMVVKDTQVHNSANLAMFMINVSYAAIKENGGMTGTSVHDLKMWFLARKQALQVLKLCNGNPNGILIDDLIRQISIKRMVNSPKMQV